MTFCIRNVIVLAFIAFGASACGMMRGNDSGTTASNNQDWFQYAYMSSAVTNEFAEEGATPAPRMKLQ